MSHDNSTAPRFVRIALTDEQRAQVQAATGREAEALELRAEELEELEERIAPLNYTKITF